MNMTPNIDLSVYNDTQKQEIASTIVDYLYDLWLCARTVESHAANIVADTSDYIRDDDNRMYNRIQKDSNDINEFFDFLLMHMEHFKQDAIELIDLIEEFETNLKF